jgi:CrcB protein
MLVVCLLGGLTTFSTFSLETIQLLEGGRVPLLLAYLSSTLFGCLIAVCL